MGYQVVSFRASDVTLTAIDAMRGDMPMDRWVWLAVQQVINDGLRDRERSSQQQQKLLKELQEVGETYDAEE